ncbi:MAG: hypothetical protein JOZ57_16355, partial [Abitibacteriaceae bacterium]|nr:hypothetical protein [Abditibacteriaceae bacterium]
RAGTVAADLPDPVPPAEQNRRVDVLLELARQLSAEYAAQFIGQTLPILVEQIDAEQQTIEGMTPHYIKARVIQVPKNTAVGDVILVYAHSWCDGLLHCQPA